MDPVISGAYTDDPDSFIIGDRVWVQGIKPGYIVYIGEVRFANGEWAGIVLDKPEGKNDGSVHGVRYFQCEPFRGLFTRLHRLSRYPAADINNNVTDNRLSVVRDSSGNHQMRHTADGRRVTTTVTRVTKCNESIPHYALPCRPATKVITTVTTTTTTTTALAKPKSVLKRSCRLTGHNGDGDGHRPSSKTHHVHF